MVKFRVERDVLSEAVTWTARSLPPRPPAPVLSGIRIEADATGSVTLSTFDYDTSARSSIPAEVSDAGTFLVSGKLLAEISRSLPNQPVDFTLDGSKVILTCGSSRFSLLTMPVDEYPALPTVAEAAGTIDATTFARAISQVSIAAGKDDTLPLLTGVKVEIESENVTLLATDRYRLAMRQFSWTPATVGAERQALVKARTLTEVAKALTSGGSIEVHFSEGSDIIGFEAGGRRTTSLLVDGEYPPVRRLFPDSTPTYTVTPTAPLVEAAKRVSLVAERNTPIRLTFSEGQVLLEAGQGEDAQAAEVVESSLVGEEIVTAFNPGYLLDGLSALDTDFVRLSFTQGSKPAVMTGQESAEGDDQSEIFKYLLMPIRSFS